MTRQTDRTWRVGRNKRKQCVGGKRSTQENKLVVIAPWGLYRASCKTWRLL